MLVVSVDGGCPGVKNVEAGVIGATSMQFPLLMAALGVEAVAEFAKSGKKPEPTPGLDLLRHRRLAHHRQARRRRPLRDIRRRPEKCWG